MQTNPTYDVDVNGTNLCVREGITLDGDQIEMTYAEDVVSDEQPAQQSQQSHARQICLS